MADDKEFDFLKFLRKRPEIKQEELKRKDQEVHQTIKEGQQDASQIKAEDKKIHQEIASEQKHAQRDAKESDALEITAVTGIFKKFFKKDSTPGDSGFDIKKVGSWLWKYRVVFLLLIPLLLSISIRTSASDVPIADNYGGNNVINFIRSDISNFYAIQYPNLPNENRARRVDEEFNRVMSQPTYTIKTGAQAGQTFNIEQQVQVTSAQFRSFFQYEANGVQYTYMPDIDPYTYLRWARNYIETGDIADERRNGIAYDNHMVAPLGAPMDTTLHPFVLAWIYKVMSTFNSKITLMQAATYFPVIIIALSVIPVFFIGRRVGGTTAGFFAAMIFVVNAALLGRTTWGHADTDAYNAFFPLYITWCFLESYYRKSWLSRGVIIAAAGVLMGLFAYVWVGWWYIFDFLLAVAGIYLVYLLWIHRKQLKAGITAYLTTKDIAQHIFIVVIFILVSGIFVTAFSSFHTFKIAPLSPFEFIKIKDAAKITLFPNVLTTVAELNAASLEQVVDQMGRSNFIRIPFFLIAIIGLLLLVLPRKLSLKDIGLFIAGLVWYIVLINSINRLAPFTFLVLFMIPVFTLVFREAWKGTNTFDVKLALILIIWFVATMYASTKGIRFVMLLVPAFSVAFGAGVGLLSRAIGIWGSRLIHLGEKIVTAVIIAVFALMLIAPIQTAYARAAQDLPIVNDAWYESLIKIKDNSQPTAIITSWWDFGHHFKYYSDRRVTFDGASQNEPMAHWVGKILLTDDEELAIGLLRMLDCGSRKAFDILNAEVDDASVSVQYIYDTVRIDDDDAREYLEDKGISDETIDEYLSYTHCDPPEAFFIASGDMIGKSGVWSHFGSWDFNRADIWVFAKNMPADEGITFIIENNNVSEEEATRLYNEVQRITNEQEANTWISPWPGYNAALQGCGREGNYLTCSSGVEIDLETMEATLAGPEGRINPKAFVYVEDDEVIQKRYDNSTSPFGVTLIPSGNSYSILLASNELSAGMFTRMYYLQGHGLKYFKPFHIARDASGLLIYTYEVDWTGENATITYDGVPELIEEIEIIEIEEIIDNETVTDETEANETIESDNESAKESEIVEEETNDTE